MPRYTLRTLLILLAVGPMVLAVAWDYYCEYKRRQSLCNDLSRNGSFVVHYYEPPTPQRNSD